MKATKSVSLERCKPEQLNASLANVTTVDQALKIAHDYPTRFPSIAKMRMHYGNEPVEGIIKLYLIELSELINLKRPLSEKQIDVIASMAVSQYYNMTIADISIMFKKVLKGDYGDFYESLDVPKVMKWFSAYFSERCEVAMEDSINNQYYDKGGNITSERARNHFDSLEKKFNRSNKR